MVSIEQAYVCSEKNRTVRIRKKFGITVPTYELTYKHKLEDKKSKSGRVIEITQDIDERDYEDLFSESTNKLQKSRFIVYDKNISLNWEIDFFYNVPRSDIYFILAEIELPEGIVAPKMLPKFITEFLLYDVNDNSTYSSKKLSDMEYAISKYNELCKLYMNNHGVNDD